MQLEWFCHPTGQRHTAKARTAFGGCTWRRTSASCWTSVCECGDGHGDGGVWDPCSPLPSPPCSPRLRLGSGDVLTFYDGDDLTARILGQYTGARGRFKLYASTADVTVQFQSDPGAGAFAYRQGFVIHFSGEAHGGIVPSLSLVSHITPLTLSPPQRSLVMIPAPSCQTSPMAGRHPRSRSCSMAPWSPTIATLASS